MAQGIVYLAYNKISKKSYVGQTTRILELRKKEHFRDTIKKDYKFSNALKKYPENSWEWTVLAEVEVNKLNEYEDFFIKDLDTYKNGYNTLEKSSWNGENHPRFDSTIYELWHPEYGEIKETISELSKRHIDFSKRFYLLKNEKTLHIHGYVLLKNKDKYNEILNIISLFHIQYETVTLKCKEFTQKYGLTSSHLGHLKSGKLKSYKGWVLAKNKTNYEELIDKSEFITLTHPTYGSKTLKRSEFKKVFNLSSVAITLLKNGKHKTNKGWRLPS